MAEPALTSMSLTNTWSVQCMATPVTERPVDGGVYERTLELSGYKVVHGIAAAAAKQTLIGFTRLAAAERTDDPRSATLALDTQRLFDRPWPAEAFPVLVIVGGPAVAPVGPAGTVPSISTASAPVRGFAMIGADADLASAMRRLVGWQSRARAAAEPMQAALEAGHPLVQLDALRIAVANGAIDHVALAATELLHPGQPTGVRAEAIELVATAIAAAEAGSAGTEQLIAIARAGWELEQREGRKLAAALKALAAVLA